MKRYDKIFLVCVISIAFALAIAVAKRIQSRLHPPMQRLTVTPERVIGTIQDFRGEPDSPYTLVEFGDYQCGPCAQQESKVNALLTQYRGRLKLAFRNYPLSFHPFALPASLAAESARRQDKFWRVHDNLYARKGQIDKNAIDIAIKQANTDSTRFRQDSRDIAAKVVQRDQSDGKSLNVSGTPAFFLCGPNSSVWRVASLKQVEEYMAR